MNASSSPNLQTPAPEFAAAAPRRPSSSPAATQPALAAPRGTSSSPNRSLMPASYPWLSRMPLTIEQLVFLTLGVVMFATALIGLQVVLLVTLVIMRLF